MSKAASSKPLPQFSWEEWDQQLIVVLYRLDRRFVVKRYVERVFANSSRWQEFSEKAFVHIEPISRAYPMKESEVKLMHEIFTWHFNGTLKFPIIAGLDQMIDWEDLLDFIERAELFLANRQNEDLPSTKSPSLVPTIPVGLLSSTSTSKSKVHSVTPIKSKSGKKVADENYLATIESHWIQINNICVPYLLKSQQTRYLPYQILLDCDLLTEEEDRLVRQLTIAATATDIQTFQWIISSTSSIDFKLAEDLRLIDLFHLIFVMSKIVYVKFVQQQKFVNKTFKNVLAQHGGTIQLFSHSIPFIRLGKIDYILLESFNSAMKPSKKILSTLRRRALPAETHEIEYLRLVQFYQRKTFEVDDILLRSNEEQLLISIPEIGKQMENLPVVFDATLNEYQRNQHERIVEDLATNIRKATKRQANGAMIELKNLRMDKTSDVQ